MYNTIMHKKKQPGFIIRLYQHYANLAINNQLIFCMYIFLLYHIKGNQDALQHDDNSRKYYTITIMAIILISDFKTILQMLQ